MPTVPNLGLDLTLVTTCTTSYCITVLATEQILFLVHLKQIIVRHFVKKIANSEIFCNLHQAAITIQTTLRSVLKQPVFVFWGTRTLSTPLEHSLREAEAWLGYLVRPGLEPATPSAEKQADVFSHLLHSVLRLGSCQWNWVEACATAAFEWSLMVSIRPPNPM